MGQLRENKAFATSVDIDAAYRRLAANESPSVGGYEQRIARLAAAREALLGSVDDGL
jgi:curved DNA-binding protein CbpA